MFLVLQVSTKNCICLQDEHFHLYDVKNQDNLETLDLSIVQVVKRDFRQFSIRSIYTVLVKYFLFIVIGTFYSP